MRQQTRGIGEKVQSKELRNIQLPQQGLRNYISPSAENCGMRGFEVIRVGVKGIYFAANINSNFIVLNQNTYPISAFAGIKRGEASRGKGIGSSTLPGFANYPWIMSYSPFRVNENNTYIPVVTATPQETGLVNYKMVSLKTNLGVFSSTYSLVQTRGNNSIALGENRHALPFPPEYLELKKGGVFQSIPVFKGDRYAHFTSLNGKSNSVYLNNTNFRRELVTPPYTIRTEYSEFLGMANYLNLSSNVALNARKFLQAKHDNTATFDSLSIY